MVRAAAWTAARTAAVPARTGTPCEGRGGNGGGRGGKAEGQEMRGTEILPHGEVAGDEEVREVRGGGGRGGNPSPGGDEVGGRRWEGVAPILSNSPIANESITGFGLPIVPAPV